MIADMDRFIAGGTPCWKELEAVLDRMDRDGAYPMDSAGVRRFHYLYRRTAGDRARIEGFAAHPELRAYLDALVARACKEIHEPRRLRRVFSPTTWFFRTFPAAFRRHVGAFALAAAVTLVGGAFGAVALHLDRSDREILLPFEHLHGSPAERVAREEKMGNEGRVRGSLSFSGYLMMHNTRVAVSCLALGLTFGVGTLLILFYNGAILGAVVFDYLAAGKAAFLLGWLLPHGVVEIPAILMAGQGGFVLAGALWGRSRGLPPGERFRLVRADLADLMGGVMVLLVWAGLVEALFSLYHEPVLPYSLKIWFGIAEVSALTFFLSLGGAASRKGVGGGENV